MQRHHRNRHRLMWILLGPLALALLVYAVVNRPTWPTMDTLPGEANPPITR